MTRWTADINAAGGDVRLSRSTMGDDGAIVESPAALLARAQGVVGGNAPHGLTLDRYTSCRIIASELGSGTAPELLCLIDADLNSAAAKRLSVFDHATAGHGRFGRQGSPDSKPRPVATSKDPTVRHYRAVMAMGEGARGIARGARRYFDPKTQLALWEKGTHHHPALVVERWTWNKEWAGKLTRDRKGRMLRKLGPARPGGEEWVGPIDGVDAWELMLFRPATVDQKALYRESLEVVTSRGKDQQLGDGALLRVGLCVATAAASVALRGAL